MYHSYYTHVCLLDLFYYQIRLPKGLQRRQIPEVQIEIPAYVISTLSEEVEVEVEEAGSSVRHTKKDPTPSVTVVDDASTSGDDGANTGANDSDDNSGEENEFTHKLFTVLGNAEVEMGNRMLVKIPSVGKVKIQFPLNSTKGYTAHICHIAWLF